MKRALFIPDCHIPYHDKHAFKLMLRAARGFKPDIVVVLGDFGDFYATSQHRKNPNKNLDLKVEIDACGEALDQIDALGADEKYFLSGNHEWNLERYLADNASALYNMLRVQELFGLKRRGWKYTPYMSHLKIGKAYFTHDCGSSGPTAAAKARDLFHANVIIGHCHIMATSYAGDAKGDSHFGASLGWLGDFSQVEYLHKVQSARWQHGFGTGLFEPNGNIHLSSHPIVNGSVVVDGKMYRLPS